MVVAVIGGGAPGVAAEQPAALRGQITDPAGVLGSRRADVQRALDRLNGEQNVQLFVVYVNDFAGRSASTWADETARLTGMGRRDLLLAVATKARQYYVSAESGFQLSDQRIDDVAAESIEPSLQAGDWAGAGIGAADGFRVALAGGGSGSSGSDGALFWLLPLGAVGLAPVPLLLRRRRKHAGTPAGPPPPPQISLDELDTRAGRLLVATDDAVKTSTQELGFAEAQFGTTAIGPFSAAVAFAREQLTAAFRLRQRLDDSHPEDDATRRTLLEEIISRCEEADRRLDLQAAAFDRLRDLEANAPQVLAETVTEHDRQAARVDPARADLAGLAALYPAEA
ncbi:TPM domain-containing protein, partial [Actinocorallia lasiicapitis]